jgi:hypothetical protein
MNGPLLSRELLQEALERLAHHLDRRGIHAELYLFGGGTMVLAQNARDATMDLDTAIRRHHGSVVAEARVVAAELGLPSWWLNEQATSYLPPGPDVDGGPGSPGPHGCRRVSPPSLGHEGSRRPPGRHCRHPRPVPFVGASSAAEVSRIAMEVFGDESLSDRSRAVLADLDDALHQS